MPQKKKLGKFVLLEEIDKDHLGVSYLAARLGPSGLDRIVTLLRYSAAVSGHTEARARLTEKARQTARLPLPGLLRILGIGRAEQSYYASFELMEGRTVRTVIDRARQEGFPFAADNALMVASRAAVVLEALHSRKDEAGAPLHHGLVKPSHLVVSWEGEVKLTGLGLWASLRNTGLMGESEQGYLAPEQRAGEEPGDAHSDVYALALVLLEMLTGRRSDGSDPLATLATARYTTPTGEEEPIPTPIQEILRIGLAPEPSARYPAIADMRKAIDTLLFSGDFTPTTFNLAFFMHSLFRQDMERESATLEEASHADYTEYLPVATPVAAESPPEDEIAPSPSANVTLPEVDPPRAPETAVPAEPESPPASEEPDPGAEKETLEASPPNASTSVLSSLSPIEVPSPAPGPSAGSGDPDHSSSSSDSTGSGRRRPVATPRPARAREGSLKFARAQGPKQGGRGLALAAGLFLAIGLGGGLGYLYFTQPSLFRSTPVPTTLSPDAVAAQARVQELEAQLAELERENARMEADAEHRAQEVAEAAIPQAPDLEAARQATERARAEARRREQARRVQREAEIRDIERELRGAERRLVAQQQATHEALQGDMVQGTLPVVSTPPPTPKPLPPPTRRGDLVDATDPGLLPPQFLEEDPVRYPPAAQRLKRSGRVRVEALVDERGKVLDARVLDSSNSGLGFEDAALRQVKTRTYRPGTKNGVAVRVWIPILVNFKL